MRTAEDAITAFAQWDGVAEYPPGSNQNWLTEWYGMGAVAWCAITVSRALIEGGFGNPDRINMPGVDTTTAKGWAYCPYVEADFRAADRWYSDPEPGDLVLFDWDDDGWSDHIGMVATVEADGSVFAWEGNTDEGAVRLKHRSRTYIRGFARPPYVPTPDPTPTPKPSQEDDEMFTYSTAANVDGGSIWFVVSGVAHRLHLPEDADRIDKAGVLSLGEMSAAFHGVFDHRG